MKTYKKSLAALMILSGVFMTACQKKSDNNAAPAASTPLITLNCNGAPGCVSNSPGLLISANGSATSTYGQFDFAMDFIGDTTRFNAGDPKAIVTYNGAATISGYLKITGGNFCGLQAGGSGEYLMQASQQGTMNMGAMSGARMSGTGPNNFRMDATVSQAVLYNSQDGTGIMKGAANNRVRLIVTIDTVNGQPCGLTIQTP